jgi:hypothetical protein
MPSWRAIHLGLGPGPWPMLSCRADRAGSLFARDSDLCYEGRIAGKAGGSSSQLMDLSVVGQRANGEFRLGNFLRIWSHISLQVESPGLRNLSFASLPLEQINLIQSCLDRNLKPESH